MSRLTNLAALGMVVAALVVGVARYHASPAPAKVFLPTINFHTAPRTLIIAVRRGCEFCEESATFHRSLVAERNERQAPLQIVVATTATASDPDDIGGDRFVVAPKGSLPIETVPTLILTDSRGRVLKRWAGAGVSQDEVRRALF